MILFFFSGVAPLARFRGGFASSERKRLFQTGERVAGQALRPGKTEQGSEALEISRRTRPSQATSSPGGTRQRQCASRCAMQRPVASASVNRPSDRRGQGSDPRPQCAFKMSMFNVPCNSH